MRGIIYARNDADRILSGRSMRSVGQCGGLAVCAVTGEAELVDSLCQVDGPVIFLIAGAWLRGRLPAKIPSSATGLPLMAYGGGEPIPRCIYMETGAAREWAIQVRTVGVEESWKVPMPQVRQVPMSELATGFDAQWRVLQVVTSLQIGGAERVTLELASGLRRRGHEAFVATLGSPTRAEYPHPPGYYDLRRVRRSPDARAAAIVQLARRLAVDVIHGHLLSADECQAIRRAAAGIPLAVTMHNMPGSWPTGFESGPDRPADVLIACSKPVGTAVLAAKMNVPCRVAWNGIDARAYVPDAARAEAGRRLRAAKGWGERDFIVVSVANIRGQKALDRIPGMIAELQSGLPDRTIRWVLAGTAIGTANSQEALSRLENAMAGSVLNERMHLLGAEEGVADLLAASDVFLSTSKYEGLSLAHLEALAAGLPVVATDVGGASDIAGEVRREAVGTYEALPSDASDGAYVQALRKVVERHPVGRVNALPKSFTRDVLSQRMASIYHSLLVRQTRGKVRRSGIWILTNNFAMGGAQSSARRLLKKWLVQGVPVRALTVEESRPTRGSLTVEAAGVPVTRFQHRDVARIVDAIVTATMMDPPEAVLFWNLMPSVKVPLAEALCGSRIRLFDVSPGEMNFHSLERYFLSPRTDVPIRTMREYGALLSGGVVKYSREKQFAEAALGCPIRVIRNGVPEFPPVDRRPAGSRLVFGTAVRISPDKRMEDLLDGFLKAHRQLPPYELRIAGRVENGAREYAERLKRQANPLPVEWCGEFNDIWEFLRGLDVFVMISEPAGCPNASLEALASGLPVIATDVGGADEQILDGVCGRLVPRQDPVAFAAAIAGLAADPQARIRMGACAREHVRREFSLDAMAENYLRMVRG